MEVSGEFTFDAPQQMVWEALRDPDVLGKVMPGGEGFEEVGENEYTGNLNVKVGPVQGKFKGDIKLSDIVEPESYRMEVDGKGAPGFVKADGSLHLTGDGEQTHMTYEGTARIGGRIASVGQRLLDASAKSVIRQSLEGLNGYLQVQMAGDEAEEEAATAGEAAEGEGEGEAAGARAARRRVPEYTPPTQTEVAINVAKDVAADLVPAEYRPVVVGVAAGLVVVFLAMIFARLSRPVIYVNSERQ